MLEQAALRSESGHITADELLPVLREAGIAQPEAAQGLALAAGAADLPQAALRPLAELVADVERQAIRAALAQTGGNKLAASRLLGISRATLYERLEALSDI